MEQAPSEIIRADARNFLEPYAEMVYIAKSELLADLIDFPVAIPKEPARLLYSAVQHIFGIGGIHLFAEELAEIDAADADGVRHYI